jgi:hypothetical protein
MPGAYTLNEPVEIPADATASAAITVSGNPTGSTTSGTKTETIVYTLPKLSPLGATGSATVVNGKLTSFTKPR